jgi:hypothetical protein
LMVRIKHTAMPFAILSCATSSQTAVASYYTR